MYLDDRHVDERPIKRLRPPVRLLQSEPGAPPCIAKYLRVPAMQHVSYHPHTGHMPDTSTRVHVHCLLSRDFFMLDRLRMSAIATEAP
jgi:hypothetical protein